MSRIFVHCYDHQRPTGGQKDTYKLVDALVSIGFEAFVVHAAAGFRLSWFANQTPVIDRRQFAATLDPYDDVLVLPRTSAIGSTASPVARSFSTRGSGSVATRWPSAGSPPRTTRRTWWAC